MSAPPYMKLFIADYLADTTHLTRDQHGAYLLLLMAMWRAGGKLPNNDLKLAAIAKCTAAEWKRLRPVVMDFFVGAGGSFKHKRIAKELAKYQATVDRRAEAQNRAVSEKINQNSDVTPRKHDITKTRTRTRTRGKLEGPSIGPSNLTEAPVTGARPDGAPVPAPVTDLNELRARIAREAAELEEAKIA